ncbi:type VII secretion protein EssA [Bacillus sp. V5-8f]|uniref:type VII secretion protein EssA n=1 Tax=Bacillus sp. V5-8f TaxID=2053044 RepID=UPI000C78630A|nr:type VII secretion protein EssA [Bacillus sp. V5-8f]PLT31937.1 type VII secretion protein EssA [Bacillus sp. V5-8f]
MKGKRSIAYYLLPLCIMALPGIGSAEEKSTVKPNQYKEKEIDLQTDYFHEESLLEKKQSLPEEQKSLTFIKGENLFFESARHGLFQSSSADNNTIKAKAEQLELFSSQSKMLSSSNKTEEDNGFILNLTIVLGIIAVIAAVCLFLFLVPQMGKGDTKAPNRQG